MPNTKEVQTLVNSQLKEYSLMSNVNLEVKVTDSLAKEASELINSTNAVVIATVITFGKILYGKHSHLSQRDGVMAIKKGVMVITYTAMPTPSSPFEVNETLIKSLSEKMIEVTDTPVVLGVLKSSLFDLVWLMTNIEGYLMNEDILRRRPQRVRQGVFCKHMDDVNSSMFSIKVLTNHLSYVLSDNGKAIISNVKVPTTPTYGPRRVIDYLVETYPGEHEMFIGFILKAFHVTIREKFGYGDEYLDLLVVAYSDMYLQVRDEPKEIVNHGEWLEEKMVTLNDQLFDSGVSFVGIPQRNREMLNMILMIANDTSESISGSALFS